MIKIQQNYLLGKSPLKSQPDTETDQNQDTCLQETICFNGRSKLKSSLCKNFITNGNCPYGNRCQFAHGTDQLRCNTVVNTSYKTKHCFSFIKKGVCPYGNRCNFIHKDPNKEKIRVMEAMMQHFPQLLTEKVYQNSRLLSKIQVNQ